MDETKKAVDEDLFDRQKRIAGWSQDNVAKAKCLVVGAGALGNEVVKNLVQLGVLNITLVDYDEIVPANLNRCVFFEKRDADSKRLKAEVVAERATNINPDASIAAEIRRIEHMPEKFYRQFDYAFGCLDSLGARIHLNAHCYGVVPYFDGGTTGFMGKVQVVDEPSSCVECGMSKQDYSLLWKRYSCVGDMLDFLDPKMPALPTTTSLVASVQVNEFAKLVHSERGIDLEARAEKSLVGKYLFFNGLTNDATIYQVPKRKECPVHSD